MDKLQLNQNCTRAEPTPFPAYVSLIDVLGLSQMLEDRDPVWVYRNVVCLLHDTVQRALTYYSERAAEYDSESYKCGWWEHSTPLIRSMFFADTLILYVHADASWGRVPRVALYTMTNVLSALLGESLRHRILLRGALSFGTILVDEVKSTILGQPISEAHRLELDQEWVGIALCDSLLNQTSAVPMSPEDPRVVRPGHRNYCDESLYLRDYFWHIEPKITAYPVPLKSTAPKALDRWVISWMPDVDILGAMALEARGHHRAKFLNTMRFAKIVAASEGLLRSLALDNWGFYPPRTLRLSKDDYASTRPLDEGDDQFGRAVAEMVRLSSLAREKAVGDREPKEVV